MGANTKIEWAHHTFNPVVGCTKISAACDHCYAEGWAKRTGQAELWNGERRRTSVANWKQPLKWANAAAWEGKRARVFCASLADVFDNQWEPEWRRDLFNLIWETRASLDWLLLTKRPQNLESMLTAAIGELELWPWPNVWLGTTVENQSEADRRIEHLLGIPARIHFLSCEPLLGELDLTRWLHPLTREHDGTGEPLIDWIIAGGESGPGARPMNPSWARSLRDQCDAAGVAFHFKQHGDWLVGECDRDGIITFADGSQAGGGSDGWDILIGGAEDHRGEPKKLWREFWATGTGQIAKRPGKVRAGRLLDGRTHDEFPQVTA